MKTIEELRADAPQGSNGLTSQRVSAALAQLGIRHVIIGGHAMAAYGYVRNTEDVDVIAVDMERAATAIAACHGQATAVRQSRIMSTAIVDGRGAKLADVIDFHQGAAFINGIPSPDALMALKFEAFTGAGRPSGKRHLDIADLMFLIERHHQPDGDHMRERVDFIAALVDKDSCGDADRGGTRWRALHDAIVNGRPITVAGDRPRAPARIACRRTGEQGPAAPQPPGPASRARRGRCCASGDRGSDVRVVSAPRSGCRRAPRHRPSWPCR